MTLSRVGLIGDVHAEDETLEAALHFIEAAGGQHILCVGDIVDGRGNADRCCVLLRRFNVFVVRGNHDRWLLQSQMRDLPDATPVEELSEDSKSFIRSLPATRSFETTVGQLLLCHGLGDNDMQRLAPDDYGYALQCNGELNDLISRHEFRFVAGGHTHRRMVRRFGNLTVINAGTLYHAHEPCIALVDFENGVTYFHDVSNGDIDSVGQAHEL